MSGPRTTCFVGRRCSPPVGRGRKNRFKGQNHRSLKRLRLQEGSFPAALEGEGLLCSPLHRLGRDGHLVAVNQDDSNSLCLREGIRQAQCVISLLETASSASPLRFPVVAGTAQGKNGCLCRSPGLRKGRSGQMSFPRPYERLGPSTWGAGALVRGPEPRSPRPRSPNRTRPSLLWQAGRPRVGRPSRTWGREPDGPSCPPWLQ